MSDGFHQNERDDKASYQKTVALCIAAASVVMLLFLIVLYLNTDSGNKEEKKPPQAVEKEDDILADSSNLVSQDLDFWNTYDSTEEMHHDDFDTDESTEYYPDDSDSEDVDTSDSDGSDYDDNEETDDVSDDSEAESITRTEYKNPDGDDEGVSRSYEEKKSIEKDSDLSSMTDKTDVDDANVNADDSDVSHIAVTDDKGRKTLYEIMPDVPKNSFDFNEGLYSENGRLVYSKNDVKGRVGIDLSKYNQAIDFARAKEDGVEYAMLRLGARGYGTGALTLDEKFVEYAHAARASAVPIGVYFYSQAINETEAIEEANYTVGAITNFDVTYPIAIDVERVENDSARTDNLTIDQRTANVKAFCDTVKQYGFNPVIYAKRDMLIAGLDLSKLKDYDIWLADYNEKPDFPYRFTMWQYTDKGHIEGVEGDVDISLCFIPYEDK